jgi:hypothetical protein
VVVGSAFNNESKTPETFHSKFLDFLDRLGDEIENPRIKAEANAKHNFRRACGTFLCGQLDFFPA